MYRGNSFFALLADWVLECEGWQTLTLGLGDEHQISTFASSSFDFGHPCHQETPGSTGTSVLGAGHSEWSSFWPGQVGFPNLWIIFTSLRRTFTLPRSFDLYKLVLLDSGVGDPNILELFT